MKGGGGMMQEKRMEVVSMGEFNGVMGKNPGSRHQLHKESPMDRSPYYDKVGPARWFSLLTSWSELD